MLAYMKRTTVKVSDDVDRAMREEAQRREMTLSEWAREAIEAHLPRQGGQRRLLATGAGASGRSDTARRAEEILAAELGSAR
jgi:predicted transcriptional regulator